MNIVNGIRAGFGVAGLMFVLATGVFGQAEPTKLIQQPTPTPTPSNTGAIPRKKIARIDPYGFIDLPLGFKLTGLGGSVDWWYGQIVAADTNFKIFFASGTVESLFEKYKKEIICTKEEIVQEQSIKIALMRVGKQETLLAKVGWAQFSADVKDETEKEIFLAVVRSYRKEITK